MSSQNMSEIEATGDETSPAVLFVDDEPDVLEMYELFCSADYAVRTAAGGEEALEQFGPSVELVCIDRRMPGLSGEAVVERLRSQGNQTPVVFTSAVDPDAEPSVEYEAYLTKPIGRDQIQATVDRHLS